MTRRAEDHGSFVVNSYDCEDQSEQTMSLEGVRALDPKRYDHFLDLSRDQLAFRDQGGHWNKQPLWATCLGKTALDVLFAIQLHAGHFVQCHDLVSLTGNEYLLVPGNVSKHLVTLRGVHQEHWTKPWFFLTRRSRGFAVMWPAERSWIRIERIDPRLTGTLKVPTRPAA
jgi:hypothetical protein